MTSTTLPSPLLCFCSVTFIPSLFRCVHSFHPHTRLFSSSPLLHNHQSSPHITSSPLFPYWFILWIGFLLCSLIGLLSYLHIWILMSLCLAEHVFKVTQPCNKHRSQITDHSSFYYQTSSCTSRYLRSCILLYLTTTRHLVAAVFELFPPSSYFIVLQFLQLFSTFIFSFWVTNFALVFFGSAQLLSRLMPALPASRLGLACSECTLSGWCCLLVFIRTFAALQIWFVYMVLISPSSWTAVAWCTVSEWCCRPRGLDSCRSDLSTWS